MRSRTVREGLDLLAEERSIGCKSHCPRLRRSQGAGSGS